MLHLYYKPTCSLCQRVLKAGEQIGVSLELLDVSADEKLREELIIKGGKKQVPFLVDDERGVMMYESGDIIEYLNEHYGKGGVIDNTDSPKVCPID
jgi:glutathione S-transferase